MGRKWSRSLVFNGKKWLNENHIEEQLKHPNLAAIVSQYSSELRKQRQVLQNCDNYQPCRRFLEGFAKQIIMDCRTTPAVYFKTRQGFSQHDPIMTQEQSVLSKIMTLFAAEETMLQCNVLSYRIDAYFPKYKLAIEVDEQGHNNRDIDCEIERQKAIKSYLVVNSLVLIWSNKSLIFLLKSTESKITLLNRLKN